MNLEGFLAQLVAMAVAQVGAPLVMGWVNQ